MAEFDYAAWLDSHQLDRIEKAGKARRAAGRAARRGALVGAGVALGVGGSNYVRNDRQRRSRVETYRRKADEARGVEGGARAVAAAERKAGALANPGWSGRARMVAGKQPPAKRRVRKAEPVEKAWSRQAQRAGAQASARARRGHHRALAAGAGVALAAGAGAGGRNYRRANADRLTAVRNLEGEARLYGSKAANLHNERRSVLLNTVEARRRAAGSEGTRRAVARAQSRQAVARSAQLREQAGMYGAMAIGAGKEANAYRHVGVKGHARMAAGRTSRKR